MMESDDEAKPGPDDAFAELLRKVARAPPIALGERGDRELVGRTIGHFRVDSHIGSGGMGDVYLATDERLARKVAVKVLPRDVAEDSVRRALLIREARTAAAITHANVAGVFEVGEHEGRPYIAMEYVDGRTLRTLLSRGPLPAREAYEYALQMARGLASAHRVGIVHRDLKPDNVMLDGEGTVKVLDFGLAKRLIEGAPAAPADREVSRLAGAAPAEGRSEIERAAADRSPVGWSMPSHDGRSGLSAAGTRAYMAPERMSGAKADSRADVFAFGASVFELLTGRPGQADERLPARAHRPFARVVERCLRADPAERYADAEALEEALLLAAPASGWRRAAAAACALAVVAAVGVAGASAARHRAAAPSPRLEQLTFNSTEAHVYRAALSPNGEDVAYVETRGVFVQRLADRRIARVETSPKLTDFWETLAWFPDGRRLLVGACGPDGRADLWAVDAASGVAARMHVGEARLTAAISPDGERIAVVDATGIRGGTVDVVDLRRGSRTRVYETRDEGLSGMPRWSPDGDRIAFVRARRERDYTTFDLDVADVTTSRRRTVTTDDYLAQETGEIAFDWRRDGRLVFARAPTTSEPERSGLFAIDARDLAVDSRDGRPAAVRPFGGLAGTKISDVTFDATGERAVIVQSEAEADVVAGRIAADGSRLEEIQRVTLSDRNEWPSEWTADSQRILMVARQERSYQALVLSTESRDMATIAGVDAPGTWPVPGPRGEGVLYWQLPRDALPGARLDLMIVRAGEQPRAIYRTPVEVYLPGYGRPGPKRWTVRCAHRANACFLAHPAEGADETVLEALDVDRAEAAPISRFPGGWQFGFALSPDGARIAVAASNRRSIDVFTVHGAPVQHLAAPNVSFNAAAWMPDGDAVIATGATDDTLLATVWRLELDGGQRTLWTANEGFVVTPVVSPDGARLAFTVMRRSGNAWLASGVDAARVEPAE